MMRQLLVSGMVVVFSLAARAEEAVKLKDGPGRDIVEGYCGACHSLDYPRINAPLSQSQGLGN
jgi:sulfite dehydrogenase (cytochrome) subunit B